jgi:hypothetical protein
VAVTEKEVTAISVIDSIDTNLVQRTMQKIADFQAVVQGALKPGHDYGIIPGCDKPSLLKPGAEKINMLMGVATGYEIMSKEEDFDKGFYAYNIRCFLSKGGMVICEGVGSCNSKEKKYISQDPHSIANTILKMAKKRAYVDATLSLASLSDIFTQDIEDMPEMAIRGSNATNQSNQGKAPADIMLTFGKYKGKTVSEIYSSDKGYFDWMLQNNDKMKGTCQAYLDSLNNPAPEPTTNGNGNGKLTGGSTPAQQQKIHIVAQEKGYNTAVLIKERFGIESGSTKDLTKQQASDLITWLVDALPAQADGQQELGGLEREPGDDDWPPIPEEEPSF